MKNIQEFPSKQLEKLFLVMINNSKMTAVIFLGEVPQKQETPMFPRTLKLDEMIQ